MSALDRLSPERRRQVLAVTAAGGLVVVFLIARRRNPADATLVPAMPSGAELGLERPVYGYDWEGSPARVDEDTPRLLRSLIEAVTNLANKPTNVTVTSPPATTTIVYAEQQSPTSSATSPAQRTSPAPRQVDEGPFRRPLVVYDTVTGGAYVNPTDVGREVQLGLSDQDAQLLSKALGRPVAY